MKRERRWDPVPFEADKLHKDVLKRRTEYQVGVMEHIITDVPHLERSVREAYRRSTDTKKEPIRYSNGRFHYVIQARRGKRRASFNVERHSVSETVKSKVPDIIETFHVTWGVLNKMIYQGLKIEGNVVRSIDDSDTPLVADEIDKMLDDLRQPPTRIGE